MVDLSNFWGVGLSNSVPLSFARRRRQTDPMTEAVRLDDELRELIGRALEAAPGEDPIDVTGRAVRAVLTAQPGLTPPAALSLVRLYRELRRG